MRTIILATNSDRAAVLHAIDAQIRPTPEERAILIKARDAQEALSELSKLREIEVVWR